MYVALRITLKLYNVDKRELGYKLTFYISLRNCNDNNQVILSRQEQTHHYLIHLPTKITEAAKDKNENYEKLNA